MCDIYVGIDTSCYMTSVACMCKDRIFQYKKHLSVKDGLCGLRQSEALFQHVKNIPLLFKELSSDFPGEKYKIKAVAASSKPRDKEGSYMPVFLAGESTGESIACCCGAEFFETSHQEGHIMATVYSARKLSLLSESFLSVHLSGGTTEILLAEYSNGGFKCEIVGGTLDLPAGQFIDRIGVLTGKAFPAGKYMDYSALNYAGKKEIKNKISVSEGYINFSGYETKIRRMFEEKTIDGETAAYLTMSFISESVKAAVLQAKEKTGTENVVMAGGVSSSGFLRESFSDVPGIYFADKDFSGDNAAGVCIIGRLKSSGEGWLL